MYILNSPSFILTNPYTSMEALLSMSTCLLSAVCGRYYSGCSLIVIMVPLIHAGTMWTGVMERGHINTKTSLDLTSLLTSTQNTVLHMA